MNKFLSDDYANQYLFDINQKIPGYSLMLEILFNAILPVEKQSISNPLIIGGNLIEVEKLLECSDSEIDLVESNKPMLESILKQIESNRIIPINSKFEAFQKNKVYDLCLCLLVIHFIENPESFIKKIYDYLEDDGILILSQFSDYHLKWWQSFALSKGANCKQIDETTNHQNHYIKSISNSQTEAFLKNVGFKRVEKICQIINIDMWLIQK